MILVCSQTYYFYISLTSIYVGLDHRKSQNVKLVNSNSVQSVVWLRKCLDYRVWFSCTLFTARDAWAIGMHVSRQMTAYIGKSKWISPLGESTIGEVTG